jgi:hypothetical protein
MDHFAGTAENIRVKRFNWLLNPVKVTTNWKFGIKVVPYQATAVYHDCSFFD